MAPGELATTGGEVARWTPPTVGPVGPTHPQPLTNRQLEVLDDVIIEAERHTGLRLATYLGDLGQDTRTAAEALHGQLGSDAPMAVLLAISPGQRVVEVVTGSEAARRISDRAARLAVLSVVAACADGDLAGALINGVRTLADQAGTLPHRSHW